MRDVLFMRYDFYQTVFHVARGTVWQVKAAIEKYLSIRLVLIGMNNAVYASLVRYVAWVDKFESLRGFHGSKDSSEGSGHLLSTLISRESVSIRQC